MVEVLIILVAYLLGGLIALRVVYQWGWLDDGWGDTGFYVSMILVFWPFLSLIVGAWWFVTTPHLFGKKQKLSRAARTRKEEAAKEINAALEKYGPVPFNSPENISDDLRRLRGEDS